MALQGEGGTEQSFALLALEGSFLRVGLQREQSSSSMFIISGWCSLQPAASVRTLMKLLKLMGEDHAAPKPLWSVDLMRKSSLGGL